MPMTVLPSVDLPHPLSPTRPTVSPEATSSDTPSTARRSPILRPNALRTGKYRTSPAISSRGAAISAARARSYAHVHGMVTMHRVRGFDRRSPGPYGPAFDRRQLASRMEPAAGWRIDQARHVAGDLPRLRVRA